MENTNTNPTPARHDLTEKERESLASFQKRLAEAQQALQNQYAGALQALIIAHGLPDTPDGYRLSENGKPLLETSTE
jgi:broad specificity phosphatase PhoE